MYIAKLHLKCVIRFQIPNKLMVSLDENTDTSKTHLPISLKKNNILGEFGDEQK